MNNDIDHINRLLADIGKRDAIAGLRLSRENTAGLKLKSGIEVLFEYVDFSRRLYIYTPLMTIAADDPQRMALLEALLDCNFLNLGCETGALALFRETGQAVYQNGFDAESLTADKLDKAIDALIVQREDALYQLDCARTARSVGVGASSSTARTTGKAGTAGLLALRLPQSKS